MILLDVKKFRNIDFTTCINNSIATEVDTYIKRITRDVINTAKKRYKFNKMNEDKQIEHFLKYSLMMIVPSKTWKEFYDSIDDDQSDGLYITLKRHYFLVTGNFPT